MKRRILLAVLTVCSIMLCTHAFALSKHYVTAEIFNPVTDGGKFITVQDSDTIPKLRFNFGLYMDYARKPVELQYSISRATRPVIDDFLMGHVEAALGITNWWEAGFDMPVLLFETFYDPDVVTNPPKETKSGLGDLRVEMKFKFLDADKYNVGLALVPFMIFPTGKQKVFISSEQFTGGAKFVLEGNIVNRVHLVLNVGYQVMKNYWYYQDNIDAKIDDLLLLGAAVHVKITDSFAALGEIYGQTVAKNAFQSKRQSPVEGIAGVRYTPQSVNWLRGFAVTMGAGRGISPGVGSTDLRAFLNLNYRKPKIVELPPPPIPAEVEASMEEQIFIAQKIHFEFAMSRIRSISYPILDDVALIMNDNPTIKMVEVEGNTDSVGSDVYNMRLSQKRAEAVVAYLVGKGVAASRLKAVGFGESKPVADNDTVKGRARNRRVEFVIQQ